MLWYKPVMGEKAMESIDDEAKKQRNLNSGEASAKIIRFTKILVGIGFCMILERYPSAFSWGLSSRLINRTTGGTYYSQYIKDNEKDSILYGKVTQDLKESKDVIVIIAEALGNHPTSTQARRAAESSIRLVINNTKKKHWAANAIVTKVPTGNGTIEAEHLYMCGSASTMWTYKYYNCLPAAFKGKIYSAYGHSNDLSFYNRREKMKWMGFDDIYSSEESETARNPLDIAARCLSRYFCSPPDSYVYRWLVDKYEIESKNARPSLLTIMTIDTHGPYKGLPPSNPEAIYQLEAHRFANQASTTIERIIEVAHKRKRELAIYIIGDHPPVLGREKANTEGYSGTRNQTLLARISLGNL